MYATLKVLERGEKHQTYYLVDKDDKVISMFPLTSVWLQGRVGHKLNIFVSDDTFQIVDEDAKHEREAA